MVAVSGGVWCRREDANAAGGNRYRDRFAGPQAERLEITEYIHRWSGNDFARIGAHHYNDIRENLWPWLRERRYAGPEDDQQLDAFLKRLGRRDVHLRPGIEVRRIWPWPHVVDLDERGALVSEVRTAVAELLTALDEPQPPACTDARSIAT